MMEPVRGKAKAKKPYPSFPLTSHPNGQWCKKTRGRVHFFGAWAASEAALERHLAVASDLRAGRQPHLSRVPGRGATVKDICNAFLGRQKNKMESGEIGSLWFEDCPRIASGFAHAIGTNRSVDDLRPEDLQRYRAESAKSLGLHALIRRINVARSVFRHAYEADPIEAPMKFGKSLTMPSAAQNREAIDA